MPAHAHQGPVRPYRVHAAWSSNVPHEQVSKTTNCEAVSLMQLSRAMDLALKAVDAAHDARTFDEFLAKITALLAHGLRADFVLLQRFSATEVNPHGLVGMSTTLAEECRRNIPRYMQEMPEITEELMQGKVLSIRESVPAERYERLAFVREIFHQLGNATDLQMVTMGLSLIHI